MSPLLSKLASAAKNHPRRFSLLAVALTLLAALALADHSLGGDKVVVVRAELGDLHQNIVVSGRVRTPQRIELSSQIGGRVAAVLVREGERVAAGQPLIRLDDAEWRAGSAQARAVLAQHEARLRQIEELGRPLAEQTARQAEVTAKQAAVQHRRVSELVGRGFYSPAQLDEAQRALDIADSQVQASRLQLASNQPHGSDVRLARSNVAQARASLDLADARLAYATLNATQAGTVLTRTVEAGDTVQPGKPLLTLAPDGPTELSAQIDEKNLALLRLGQPALVSADAYPGERFPARLAYIAPSVDAQRGSLEVRLHVAEAPPYLKHEMTVSIDIEASRRNAVLSVPADVVREASGPAPWVLVVRDGSVARQAVKCGLRTDRRIEIVAGLSAGDAVLPGDLQLPPGRRVRAVDR